MEKIEEKLIDSLIRTNFIFNNEEISTECIANHKGFSFLGESYGPFEKGIKYKLKLFIAIIFIQNNILKVAPNEKCDNIDVQRYAISERDDQKLIHRNNIFFLNKLKQFKFFIEKEVNDKSKPKIDLDRYISYTTNIIDSRLLKLLRLAKAELSLDDEQRLTSSEKFLHKRFYSFIKIWRDFFLIN